MRDDRPRFRHRGKPLSLVKILAAFGLGFALLAGAQQAYVWAIHRQIVAQQASLPPLGKAVTAPKFDTKFAGSMLPKFGPIDTREGQRLAVEGAARRIDLQNRAAMNAVPLPPRIPGFRR